MKLLRKLLLAALFAQFLYGCAGPNLKDPEKPNFSLVLFHMDMSDAPARIDWARATQYTKKGHLYYRFGRMSDDKLTSIMYDQYIQPGKYKLTAFGGVCNSFACNSDYTFNFPPQDGLAKAEFKKPGIYYLGSYKYINVKAKHIFAYDKFRIVKVKTPTEKEVLTQFLKHIDQDGKWHQMIEARLKELK